MLKQYLSRHGLTQKYFAMVLHISKAHMSMLVHRKRHPSAKLAKKIEKQTNGEISIMWLLYGGEEAIKYAEKTKTHGRC